jgi:hypothetical protein
MTPMEKAMDKFDPDKFAKLIRNTNESIALWAGGEVSAHAADSVYRRATGDFLLFTGTPRLHEWLHNKLSEDSQKRLVEARETLGDTDKFLRFLILEKEILIRAGVDTAAAEVLLYRIANIRSKVSLDESIVRFGESGSPENMSTVTTHISDANRQVREAGSDAEKRRKIALQMALEIAAWAVMAVSTSSFAGEVVAGPRAGLPVGSLLLLPAALGRGLAMGAEEA